MSLCLAIGVKSDIVPSDRLACRSAVVCVHAWGMRENLDVHPPSCFGITGSTSSFSTLSFLPLGSGALSFS